MKNPKMIIRSIRFDKQLYNDLTKLAKLNRRTFADYVRIKLEDAVEKDLKIIPANEPKQ